MSEEEEYWVVCGCCGKMIRNTPEENVDYNVSPYPHDKGYGMCKECGGDKNAKDIRKRLGAAACTFYDTRISLIRKNLSPEKREKFDKYTYEEKVYFVTRAIEKGLMI